MEAAGGGRRRPAPDDRVVQLAPGARCGRDGLVVTDGRRRVQSHAVSRAADAPLVAAVIVTWNSASTIGRCLDTLRGSEMPNGIDIVVVDNASADRTADLVTETAPEARLIRNNTNLGLAAANNQGIDATDAPWVLNSNPDVVYEPTTVAELLACAERH